MKLCQLLIGLMLLLVGSTHALAGNSQDCLQLYYMKIYQHAFFSCQTLAKAGNDQAQYVLAMMYLEGKGTDANSQQAATWFKAASRQGHAAARYKLQSIEHDDVNTAPQHFTSHLWSQQVPESDEQDQVINNSPERDDPEPLVDSVLSVALESTYSEQAPIEPAKAKPAPIKLAPVETMQPTFKTSKASAKTLPDKPLQEQRNVSNRPHYQGLNSAETAEISKALALDLAENNTRYADVEMFQYYLQAAKHGDAVDQLILGLMYLEGRGVDKNIEQAMTLLKQAAGKELAKAQYTLALVLYEGRAVKKNETLAVQWLQRAANQGFVDAQYSLGLIYATSHRMKDASQAVLWWKKAAAQQHAQAEHNLAVMYLKGLGVAESRSEAVRWFEQEAKHGDPATQFNLGQLYSEGKWLDKNGQLAANWFYRAGANHLALGQKDEAMQAANKIKQLTSQKNLTVPNSFLADVLSKQIQEANTTSDVSTK